MTSRSAWRVAFLTLALVGLICANAVSQEPGGGSRRRPGQEDATGGVSSTSPGGGFEGSTHDFSGRDAGTNGRDGRQVTTGACTFCHTPHKGYTTRLAWNHTLSSNTYSWTEITQTSGGTPLPIITPNWTGPSGFCLSCHDGSVAIGDVAWFNRRSWRGGSALDGDRATSIASSTGNMGRNHPIAAPYPYQNAPSTYNLVTTGPGVVLDNFVADPTVRGIRLFNDAGGVVVGGPQTGRTGIECTSCHGVHNERGLVKDVPLLRGIKGNDLDPEYLCSKCHSNLFQGNPHSP